jgi:hypothetical protein
MSEENKYLEMARSIPELGHGGKEIEKCLIGYASTCKDGSAIVEFGPWLGSSTSFLALGVMKSRRDVLIQSYDNWIASPDYVEKAKTYNDLNFEEGQELLPVFIKNVSQFPVSINPVKGDILKSCHISNRPIDLIVMDCGCTKDLTDHVILNYGSKNDYCIIIFMDFYFYKDHSEKEFLYQKHFVEANPKRFVHISNAGSKASVYKYTPGELVFPEE